MILYFEISDFHSYTFSKPETSPTRRVMNTKFVPLIKIYIAYIGHFCI